MSKYILFDTENGSHTLGGDDTVQDMFNCPVLRPSEFSDFMNTVNQIYTTKTDIIEKKISDDVVVKETKKSTVLKNGTMVNGIIIDSFSELAKKYQRHLAGPDRIMKMNAWGQLKNTLDALLEWVTKIPGVLVMTCHSKVENLDDGRTRIKPYIDGSTKDDISKWFDFVFYTFTKRSGKEYKYLWNTKHTEVYEHAKDRTDSLPMEMEQDFQLVLDAARAKGFKNVRILIIGSPGTGKTKSLSTLIKGEVNGN